MHEKSLLGEVLSKNKNCKSFIHINFQNVMHITSSVNSLTIFAPIILVGFSGRSSLIFPFILDLFSLIISSFIHNHECFLT